MIRVKYYLKTFLGAALSVTILLLAVIGLVHEEMSLKDEARRVYMAMPEATAVVLDLNSASERELQKISGIGEVTARAITEYRAEHGSFGSADELLNVRGIGSATLEKIRPYLTINGLPL